MRGDEQQLQREYLKAMRSIDFQSALDIARRAARFYEERDELTAAGDWHLNISSSLWRQGRYAEAVPEAELSASLHPHPVNRAIALANLAYIHIESFKLSDAFLALGQAAETARSFPHEFRLKSLIQGFSALAFERAGDTGRALVDYEAAINTLRCDERLFQQHGAHLFNNFGYFLAHNQQLESAGEHILLALDVLKRMPSLHRQAIYLDSLGYVYGLSRKPAEAEKNLRRAAQIFKAIPDKTQLVVTLLHLGELHERTGQHRAARREATRALQFATEVNAVPLINKAQSILLNIKSPVTQRAVQPSTFHGLLYSSQQMRAVIRQVKIVAQTDEVVLFYGETGTGKELMARAVHQESRRANAPFIPFNCSAITRDLIESRLFGYRRGAFTGATLDHPGVIREAAGGTLLLDEIGDLSCEAQGALLRFLQAGEIQPIGESKPVMVDVRTLAATHRNLKLEVEAGRFRADLFYRLNVATIHIPPLRSRRDDIIALSNHLLDLYSAKYGLSKPTLTGDELERLTGHDWPGNVRELESWIKRFLLFGQSSFETSSGAAEVSWRKLAAPEKRRRLIEALKENNGNISISARQLGLSRRTIQKLLHTFGLK
jgi:transcriptional regulator with GAF, ATPase, and Fis domain